MRLEQVLLAALLRVATPAAAASAPSSHPGVSSALPQAARRPAAVVDAFHAALRRGDTRAAAALLADDALIFESGEVERSKAEYAAHHLAADAEFSKAVPAVVTRRSGTAAGNFAWISSEGRMTGTFKGKPVDRLTTETMILRRSATGWTIDHVHWSSAAAK